VVWAPSPVPLLSRLAFSPDAIWAAQRAAWKAPPLRRCAVPLHRWAAVIRAAQPPGLALKSAAPAASNAWTTASWPLKKPIAAIRAVEPSGRGVSVLAPVASSSSTTASRPSTAAASSGAQPPASALSTFALAPSRSWTTTSQPDRAAASSAELSPGAAALMLAPASQAVRGPLSLRRTVLPGASRSGPCCPWHRHRRRPPAVRARQPGRRSM
jgi:hypothetical protein